MLWRDVFWILNKKKDFNAVRQSLSKIFVLIFLNKKIALKTLRVLRPPPIFVAVHFHRSKYRNVFGKRNIIFRFFTD